MMMKQIIKRQLSSSTASSALGLQQVEGLAAPMPNPNIDTDAIIPAAFLKTIKKTGLGKHLFHNMRYNSDGSLNESFVLNQEPYTNAKIIVAGDNWGTGSSREHACWAMKDFGISSVISTAIADIHRQNCYKNFILPIVLPKDQVDFLMKKAEDKVELKIDLESQTVKATDDDENIFTFDIDDFRKHMVLNGLDDIGITLQNEDKISAFEEKRKELYPWL